MTVREIVTEWLKEHGYQGLHLPDSDGDECRCFVDSASGLAPCRGSLLYDCKPWPDKPKEGSNG